MTTSGSFSVVAIGCRPRPRRSGAATDHSDSMNCPLRQKQRPASHSLPSFACRAPRGCYRTESISWSAGFQIAAFAAGLVFITEKWSATNEPFDLTPISLI